MGLKTIRCTAPALRVEIRWRWPAAAADLGQGGSGVGGSGSGVGGGGGTATQAGSGGAPVVVPDWPKAGSCGLDTPAFCDTFEQPAPGGRGGDPDETLWSVARVSQKVNSSQGELVSWPSSTLSACGKITEGVFPNQDIISCKHPTTGRTELTSMFDDANGPVFQSLRVLQPFDFDGRIGHITVDIDAKTRTPEGHGWWWELVIAD